MAKLYYFQDTSCPSLYSNYDNKRGKQFTRNTLEMKMSCTDNYNTGSTCKFDCDDRALLLRSSDVQTTCMGSKQWTNTPPIGCGGY